MAKITNDFTCRIYLLTIPATKEMRLQAV